MRVFLLTLLAAGMLASASADASSSSLAAAPAVGAALHSVKARPPPPPPATKPPPSKPAPSAICPTGGFSCSTYFEDVVPLSPADAAAVAARASGTPGQLSNGASPWNTVEPCPKDSLTNSGKTASQIEAQLAYCINAVRVNPSRYQADFTARSSCSYSSWIAGATSPRRKALSYTDARATKLDAAARKHATDMATKNFFSHTGSDRSSPMQRARAAGYTGSSLGENIAAGYSSIRAAMVAWMCSSGHRSNLLSCAWGSFGSGYAYSSGSTYKHYYVQDFGCGASSCYSCQ